MKIQYLPIIVNDKPFCFWDSDFKKKNIEFLQGFDANYFNFVSGGLYEVIVEDKLPEKDKQYAAIGIRNLYSHAMETLFAFICATLQSPGFIPGWLIKYRQNDLYTLVKKIHDGKKFRSKIRPDELSWIGISKLINQFETDSKNKTENVKQKFGEFWQRTASDFLNNDFQKEHNSIKHGYRAEPGGFRMAFGIEKTPGKPASNMMPLGGSKYGTSFYIEEYPAEDKYNIQLRKKMLNWIPKNYYFGINLVCMSLTNIKSFLLSINGVSNETLKYMWPQRIDDFNEQWQSSPGVVSSLVPDVQLSKNYIKPFTKKQILEIYDNKYDQK